MKYRIRNRYIVEIDAQIEANDFQDAVDQARDATAADLVTPRDGVALGQQIRISMHVEPVFKSTDIKTA